MAINTKNLIPAENPLDIPLNFNTIISGKNEQQPLSTSSQMSTIAQDEVQQPSASYETIRTPFSEQQPSTSQDTLQTTLPGDSKDVIDKSLTH